MGDTIYGYQVGCSYKWEECCPMNPSGQMTLAVMTPHDVFTRVVEIANTMINGVSQALPQDDNHDLSLGDKDAVHAVVESSLFELYALLNTVAPTGWVDPRVQSRSDARALKAVQDSAATTVQDLRRYLDGRATR